MTITPSLIYWVSTLNVIKGLAAMTAMLSGVCTLIGSIMVLGNRHYGENDTDYKIGKSLAKIPSIIFATTLLVAIFTPSSKTAAAMYIIPAVVNNQKIQDIGNGLGDMTLKWIETVCKEHKNNK